MLNPSAIGTSTYDVLNGNLAEFYEAVDEAIAQSEVIKGQYRLTNEPSYNSPQPVQMNAFTTVSISPNGNGVLDVDNSFITAYPVVKISSSLAKAKPTTDGLDDAFYAIYWKKALESLERYELLVNSTVIYSQTFVGEESFIQNQVIAEQVRNTQPFTYTSWKNIMEMNPNICGAYVNFTNDGTSKAYNANDAKFVKIPVRIPLSDFLPLKNLKYIMSWFGKWELRLWFKPNNLCYTPIDPTFSREFLQIYSPLDIVYMKNDGTTPLDNNDTLSYGST